ncbi:MAG: sugar transporter permease, partial [Firmicutes bacterium]|nr:sugar transporter permease [Bacillota bacterium]
PTSLARREELTAYLFLAPNLIGFLLFTVLATLASLGISFTNWDLLTPPQWAGVHNYVKLWQDPTFWKVLKNTLFFTVTSVPLTVALGLVLALGLNRKMRGTAWLRSAYFVPVVTSSFVIALVWRWLYNPDYGMMNYLLRLIGITGPNWLTSQKWAMTAVVIVSVWKGCGYAMVLFLAGLQSISDQIYEAGSIDGTNSWQRFRYLTIPLLTPTTFFVSIISLIGSFQVFDSVSALTDGGPADATRPLVMYIVDNAFTYLSMGYGAALAWVLFAIVFVITLVQWRLQRHWVHYE